MTTKEIKSKYRCELSRCFGDLLRNFEISEDSIRGTEQWLYNRPVYMTIMLINGKFNFDEENFNDCIYCCVLSMDDYYSTNRRRYIHFKYKDKVYVIKPETGDWDMKTGNLTLWCDIYEYDNEIFNFSYDSVEKYHKGKHPYKDRFYEAQKRSYQLTLNNNTNIIYEVTKRIKEEDKIRTNKKQEV